MRIGWRRLRSVTDRLLAQTSGCPGRQNHGFGLRHGYTTGKLAARYPNAEIIAQDISDGMLAVARKNAAADNVVLRPGICAIF